MDGRRSCRDKWSGTMGNREAFFSSVMYHVKNIAPKKMKISTYFRIEEFIPKEIYTRFGDKSIIFIDKRIILLADFIRDRFGKSMTINNWHSAGAFNNRGFRVPDCATGGTLSQHKFGRAIDFNISGVMPDEVAKDIMTNFDMYSKAGLTTIEDHTFTKGWTHCDIRQTAQTALLIVKP